MSENKVIIIAGPTAVGKTALSLDLAKKYDGEIINGDSQQVYRQVSIGTAKATAEEQATAVHHLIDVRDVAERFSAHDFVLEANRLIADLLSRGKLPIIVGGTGLYLQSLVEGYHLGGADNHEQMRELRSKLDKLTDDELLAKVAENGLSISQINRRRAIRALEISEFGEQLENQKSAYDFLIVGLNTDRKVLYERINNRVDMMMSAGLLDEAKMLYDTFLESQVARAIGYKEFFPYFDGQIPLAQAVEMVKQNSRRYSKRQITWFKNRMAVDFSDVFAPNFKENIAQKIERFLDDKN
ncbi:tRNA dimethylallyltransferase [Lactococcus hodotermopsidis]|uniref:tRNA dimethylallyltransferase n=1 Tax=Pseudolactococcus hodotermopsidis TaxID=2709157 RepID=A0A6A0BAE0_9LACT|nr:tRNA (adenosine(37)-N6)-dimethylallyltransferase MiaA [Lactococcus hodotermopsidis]GFH42389.1 tRNA dimethylallyltransferase [Lactococcus hodotermopsidis]